MASLIAIFYFFYFALIGVHIIFVPKILAMIGYSPSAIGIIFASAPLIRFIIPFLFLKGFKLNQTTFYIALMLMGTSAIAFYPALHHFFPILMVNIFFGIGIALILPYIEVIALQTIGKERYGRIRLYGSIGFIAVALILVKFLSSPEVGIIFLIGAALLTVFFGFIIGTNSHTIHKENCDSSLPECRFSLKGDEFLWLGFLLMQVSFGPFYNFFTIYTTDHGISLETTSWLWSFGVIIEIIMFYFQGKLLTKNLHRILILTAWITAFRWIIVALFPNSLMLLFASQSLHAFSFALFHTASISLLFSLYKARQLSQQFFFGISYGLGGFIGALGAGFLYQLISSYSFFGGTLAAVLAAVSFTLYWKQESQ